MHQVDAMRIFLKVADLSSFSQAAVSLGLPKATVSSAVQQLEAELGTRLLHRTTRRVEMTQDGQVCYERCKDVLAELDDVQQLFRDDQGVVQGRLRVDMPSAVARDIVLPQLPSLLAAHPGLEIELSSTDRRVDLVREGFDCVLRVGPLGDSRHIAKLLGHYRMVNCASPAYVAEYGMPADLADLARHRLIHYVSTLGGRAGGFDYVEPGRPGTDGQARQCAMPGALTVNNSDAYRAACLAGLGIIQAPQQGLLAHLERGELVEVLPQWRAASMPVSLMYANRRQQPRRVRLFMHWLEELMRLRLEHR